MVLKCIPPSMDIRKAWTFDFSNKATQLLGCRCVVKSAAVPII